MAVNLWVDYIIFKLLSSVYVRPFSYSYYLLYCWLLVRPIVADAWTSRWVNSEHKSDYGQFKLTAGDFYGDAEKDKGKSNHTFVKVNARVL